MVIEQESGTFYATRTPEQVRPHNGYSAGRFSEASSPEVLAAWFAWGRSASAASMTR